MPIVARPRTGLSAGTLTYKQKVLGTAAANLIAYWPMDEASGTVADNAEGTAARDGTYSNVTLGATGIGDGGTAVSFNGSTSYLNIYSASLEAAFNANTGALMCWVKGATGVWAGTTYRSIVVILEGGNDFLEVAHSGTANTGLVRYLGQGSGTSHNPSISGTAWHHLVLVWSSSGTVDQCWLDGSQVGSNGSMGLWLTPTFSSTQTVVGALNTTPASVWSGDLAHVALWTTNLSSAQISDLSTA